MHNVQKKLEFNFYSGITVMWVSNDGIKLCLRSQCVIAEILDNCELTLSTEYQTILRHTSPINELVIINVALHQWQAGI